MEIEIQLTGSPIAEKISPPPALGRGRRVAGISRRRAWRGKRPDHFRARIRGLSGNGRTRNPAPSSKSLAADHPCLAAKVIHRVGIIPVGETAIYVGVASPHRAEAIALLAEFMDRLKQDVPIWKRRALAGRQPRLSMRARPKLRRNAADSHAAATNRVPFSRRSAGGNSQSHCQPLPAVRVPLAEAFGRVLRETVCAPEDLPPFDRSTRDGYAIWQDDACGNIFSRGHASRRRLETAPVETRRSRARGDRRGVAVRKTCAS